MKDDTGVNHVELTDKEKTLVVAALQRMLVRGRYRRVDGAKLLDFQQLVAKFSNQRVVRVGRKNILRQRGADCLSNSSAQTESPGLYFGLANEDLCSIIVIGGLDSDNYFRRFIASFSCLKC